MIKRLSLEFLKDNGICDEFYEWIKTTFEPDFQYSPYMDWDYARTVLLEYIESNPKDTEGWLVWFDKLKNSKEYVYYNGEQIIMTNKYQLFNPLTGLYDLYETENEMLEALLSLSKEVLDKCSPKVIKEIGNENGDVAWIPTEIHKKIVLSINEQ
jgi:hypothetical protein